MELLQSRYGNLISPYIEKLAKYSTKYFQVFAVGFAKKSHDMKRQKKKQEKLILKMLPKEIVTKLNEGLTTAEEFDSATLYFSCVVEFYEVTKKCPAMQVVNFLNNLYQTIDESMDSYDVYKIYTSSSSYFVASALPITNADK